MSVWKKYFLFMDHLYRYLFVSMIFFISIPSVFAADGESEEGDENFSNFEIRVIRPRYFSKRTKFEAGIQLLAITNQTFIYTYMASGLLSYHVSESLGFQVGFSSGTSVDKEDKTILQDDFQISTQILRISTMFNGMMLWTPMYGKYQLASGNLIYFDTYLSAGAGLTGVAYQFSHCYPGSGVRSDYIKQYPTISGGIGQRFFMSRQSSINWDLRIHEMKTDLNDGNCVESDKIEDSEIFYSNLTVHLGYSRFF